MLREHRYLGVADLAAALGVSLPTARRDLAALSARDEVRRTFGGAVGEYERRFASFGDRRPHAADAKALIARRAAAMVRPRSRVFLDAGTTCFAVAEQLAASPPKGVEIVTHSLAVAERLGGTAGLTVTVLGGRLLPRQAVLLDEETPDFAGRGRHDLALLGAEGFDASGVWNSENTVAELQRRVVASSGRVAVLADATKLGRRAPALVDAWDGLGTLVTDAAAADLRRAGIKIGRGRAIRVKIGGGDGE